VKHAVLIALVATSMGGLVATTSDAEAQRYYAREKLSITASQEPAYTPVYSAFGACTSGKKTQTLTSCKSGTATVAKTLCASSPQTVKQDCTVTCGPLTSMRSFSGGTIGSQVTRTTQSTAQAYCDQQAALNTAGICRWNSGEAASNQYLAFFVAGGTIVVTQENQSAGYGAVCQ
jgi:hypothetical protein